MPGGAGALMADVVLPVCPECGERVVATICGRDREVSQASADAVADVLLAVHIRLAHPKEPADERQE